MLMKSLFIIRGKVLHGKNRGKELGFPTANIPLHQDIPEGVYTSNVMIDNKSYIAATFIGSAKTFNEKEYHAESYILDFSENLYGKLITIKLFKKLRENKKFTSEQSLIIQMKQDELATREFFSQSF
jgi:riboflavin kinase/FMN adenylyltransferase